MEIWLKTYILTGKPSALPDVILPFTPTERSESHTVVQFVQISSQHEQHNTRKTNRD
jgi:hypothetical protein